MNWNNKCLLTSQPVGTLYCVCTFATQIRYQKRRREWETEAGRLGGWEMLPCHLFGSEMDLPTIFLPLLHHNPVVHFPLRPCGSQTSSLWIKDASSFHQQLLYSSVPKSFHVSSDQ